MHSHINRGGRKAAEKACRCTVRMALSSEAEYGWPAVSLDFPLMFLVDISTAGRTGPFERSPC